MRLLVVVFGLFALVTAAQAVLARRAAGESGDFWPTVLYSVAIWGGWVVLIPGIVWLGRRFDFRPGLRFGSVAVHLLGALVAHVLTTLAGLVIGIAVSAPEEAITVEMVQRAVLLSSRLPLSLITYAAIIGLDRALGLWQALAEREVRLEAQATRARLDALAARLHPHFLFNTLQSVSALVDEEPARARVMLAQLGDLLRDLLAVSDEGDVTLAEEVALLGRYLAIEETRFADRLRVRLDVAPDAAGVAVPRLLLQPLAENALRHGLSPQPQGGTLQVTARRHGGRVTIRIHNDGRPLAEGPRAGVGLTVTRERLQARYGADAAFELRAVPDGVEAVVEIPG
jgi:sensor histidine kinase YesM